MLRPTPHSLALHEAAYAGDIESVRALASENPEWLHQQGSFFRDRRLTRFTPLMWACYGGRLEVAKLLVEMGSDVDAVDRFGNTALIIAVRKNELDIARFLLQQGANYNHIANHGSSALVVAVSQRNIEAVRLLVEVGAEKEDAIEVAKHRGRPEGRSETLDILCGSEVQNSLRDSQK